MLKLQPFEVCKLRDVCFYFRDCKGLDEKRKSSFSCHFADEMQQEKKEVCEFSICSLSKGNFIPSECS